MSKANDLTKQLIYLLRVSGYRAWRNNNTGLYDPVKKVFRKNPAMEKGIPDVLGFHKKTGQFVCIEVKAGKDKLTPEQTEFILEARRAGCLAFEARSIDDLINRINNQ